MTQARIPLAMRPVPGAEFTSTLCSSAHLRRVSIYLHLEAARPTPTEMSGPAWARSTWRVT